jgi:RHS repeat-associated protein
MKNAKQSAISRVIASLVIAASALLPGIAGAADCGSSPGGPPNSCPGVASTGGSGGPDAGVGNPINVMTGNKYEREVDMPALPGVLGLEIIRHYNSAYAQPRHQNGAVGRGWRLSYETELFDMYGKIQIMQADGGRVIFDRDRKNTSLCSTANPANGTMTLAPQKNGRAEYIWTWTNGRKLYFDSTGKLYRIKALTGEFVSIDYDQRNVLQRVTDPQGRRLDLAYFDPKLTNQFRGVQFIDSPTGRFEYEYGSQAPKGSGPIDTRNLLALLVRVKLPTSFEPDKPAHALTSRGTTTSQISRLYHHEDLKSPWLLTGISVETTGADGKAIAARYSTYGYDGDGRAILSTHANNVNKVTLDTSEFGKTVLTNSLGQKTTYLHAVIAGEHRLLAVRGAGCALCGETNVRYGYNAAGELTETIKMSTVGKPLSATRSEFDKLGRPTRLGKIAFVNGKPQAVQWSARFEYVGNSVLPTLIARPSVVTGKEAVTRIVYNAAGQPLSQTEAGWAPNSDGALPPNHIEHTTSYRYTLINQRSVLTEIDGPLPNGKTSTPADSDITVIEYDNRSKRWSAPISKKDVNGLATYDPVNQRRGIISAVITPGDRRSTVQFDIAGRVASVRDADGHETIFRYSPRGQLSTTTRDGITYATHFDSFDNSLERGISKDGNYQALERMGYDAAGRNIWTASHLGVLGTRQYDTENRLLEKATLSNAFRRSQRFQYDSFGRLYAFTDAKGGIRRIGWNAAGLPDEVSDALGRITRLAFDAMGNITTVDEVTNMLSSPQQKTETRFELDIYGRPTAIIAPNGAITRYVRDDFGQTLVTVGADTGKSTRSFDVAGRLVASTDANGNRAVYDYDVMGRIVRQSVTDAGNGRRTSATTWRYNGMHLIAVDHPAQGERYSYDARGRISAKTVSLVVGSGSHISYTTRYRYDDMGRLGGVSLPDGSTLDYQRNGQNQITALKRNRGIATWLRWLLPQQTIVQNMERDLVGLKRLTYGNGIEAYYQRSKEGSLARIVYRHQRVPAAPAQRNTALENLLGISAAMAAPANPGTSVAGMPVLPGALGLPSDPNALLDHRYLWDLQGNLLYTQDKDSTNGYAYDARDRLITVATSSPNAGLSRYHYNNNGNRLLAQEGSFDQNDTRLNTVKTTYVSVRDRWQHTAGDDGSTAAQYDAAGQPNKIGNRTIVWDAMGKLLEVRDGPRIIARYRYNHRGERIEKIVDSKHTYYLYENRKLVAELDARGTVRRQYVYLADQPVAVIDKPEIDANLGEEHGVLARVKNEIAAIGKTWLGNGETIVYLQSNHLGTTELVTDAQGKPVWQADYSPFGKLVHPRFQAKSTTDSPGFELNLRLPGQYEDKETGLYYNDYRYYDPASGRYLSPDPLGLRAGSNSYAYVNGNPFKYIDPSGLVLFAFDGTGNDQHDAARYTNVVKFLQLYQEKAFYISGPGTKDEGTGIAPSPTDLSGLVDIAKAYTGKLRIAAMIKRLNDYSDTAVDDAAFNIDIVGFSRGSAEGRDFANQIAANFKDGYYHYTNDNEKTQCQKVTFNFMGLFDTVLSTHTGDYQLGVPDAYLYVVHATALNEYRGSAIEFPSESIRGAPAPANTTRIERGFLGAHSDIGGGYPEGNLAAVALSWMVGQAKLAGVNMLNSALLQTTIANPVFHDASSNLIHGADTGGPTATSEDRDVRYRNARRRWA